LAADLTVRARYRHVRKSDEPAKSTPILGNNSGLVKRSGDRGLGNKSDLLEPDGSGKFGPSGRAASDAGSGDLVDRWQLGLRRW